MTEEKKKPTIFDVARLAKVSTTTVSRVINKFSTVKDSNRDRVEKAIKELGFVPDVSAQRLAGGKGIALGFVIPYYKDMFYTFYAMEMIKGASQGIIDHRLDLLLLHVPMHPEEYGTNILNPSYVSGLLFADYYNNEAIIAKAKELKITHLITNYYNEESKDNCLGVDNIVAAIDAVNYLVKLGHKKIATITGKPKAQSGYDRIYGYKKALQDNHLSEEARYIVEGDWSGESGKKAMRKLLSLKEKPTAVFVAGDEMAIEAIDVTLDAGLKVPGDISIIGFDDIPLASLSRVPLTTMRQPLAELGRQGVELLVKILSGELKQPVKKVLKLELVERKSCAPLK